MSLDDQNNPNPKDPLVRQLFPIRGFSLDDAVDSYEAREGPNWELPDEFPTPQLQRKYRGKAIIRTDECLAYCGFCFEVERVEDKTVSRKRGIFSQMWDKTLDYLRDHEEIIEVIFSGGDPLLVNTEVLDSRLADIRDIPHIRFIRLHTRALTFNPYRFDDELVDVLKKYSVTAIGFHITHSNELTEEAREVGERFSEHGFRCIEYANIPLLCGVNDEVETMRELFLDLYGFGIKPYYLFHGMPGSPASDTFRTSVRTGVSLINALKRDDPNLAIPEYVIVHHTGKHTVPLEENGTPEFQYTQNHDGHPIIKFKNWRGNWETYLDRLDNS
tara:strand:- start:59 stop:1048 length:990 start_codon:yes stop_codon:yes gene_type:complete